MSPFGWDPIAELNRDEAQNNLNLHNAYPAQAQAWIDANTRNREIGLPLTPVPPLPQQKIWYKDSNGNPAFRMEPFPDLQVPVLPPLVAPTPSGFGADDPNFQSNISMAIYKIVLDLQNKLTLLMSK